MSDMVTSRLSGFHKLPMAERLQKIARMFDLSPDEVISQSTEQIQTNLIDRQ